MIDYYLSKEAGELSDGEVELEQSYFGGVRKDKRGRSAGGNIAVFSYFWVKILGNYADQTQNFNNHKMKYLSHLKTRLAP